MLAIAAIVAALVVIVLLAREHPGMGYFASFAAVGDRAINNQGDGTLFDRTEFVYDEKTDTFRGPS